MAGRQPFLIGLTGPIGCGKSTVARMLAELGGTVVDADVLARGATELGTVDGDESLAAVRDRFGAGVFDADGRLNRQALAERVFGDPAALGALEQIVHPLVRRALDGWLAAAADDNVPFAVVEAIKLVEGGLAERCDEVWLIECSPTTQRERLRARGGEPADAERRLATQGTDLADRLAAGLGDRARVRRISTEASLEDVRGSVEDALAEALAPLVLGDDGRRAKD